MKRTNAVAPKQADLARRRALVRELIERHGWSSTPGGAGDLPRVVHSQLPSNVIQFPFTRR